MAWDHDSRRRAELPSNWQQLRRIVSDRAGGRCERVTNGVRCPARGTDCHHAVHRSNHDPAALEWLCPDHHKEETQREAYEGQIRMHAKGLHPRHRRAYLRKKLGKRA